MTGIAGIIAEHNWTPMPLLQRMVRTLGISSKSTEELWQGPKGALGRVRAGFDNPTPQPVFTEDNRKCIVMSGECYNYEHQKRELIRLGHRFSQAESDAEFCLHMYEQFGTSRFHQLSGSFCFAIYDTEAEELLLVSDRLGTRPLFYGKTADGKLAFASQVSAVLACPGIDRSLNVASVVEFCALQRVLGWKTHHTGIQMLPSASVLRYRSGGLSISSYWHPEYRPQSGSVDQYAEELAMVMRNTTRKLFRDNAQVAMLLSGGLDARMVVAAAESDLICYTFGDYENPEVQTARRIAEARGFEFRFLARNPDHYFRLVDQAVELGSGMHPFNHAHAIGFMDDIAQQCDVVTHGYVPELMFRGTSLPKTSRRVFGIELEDRLDHSIDSSNLRHRILRRGYSQLDKGIEKLFTTEMQDPFHTFLNTEAQRLVAEAALHSTNVHDHFLWPDVHYHGRYPSMLFETSLRAFMTERSPFFHNDVIDLHLKMPVHLRADNRVWLKAVSLLDKKIATIPDANTGYRPDFPVALASCIETAQTRLQRLPVMWRLQRQGQASDKPVGASDISWPRFDWMIQNNKNLQDMMRQTLTDPEALPPHIFDLSRIKDIFDAHLTGRLANRLQLFLLLSFGRWHKLYGK